MLTTTKLYDIFHIVNGEHSDPHTVLGMHEMEEDGRKAVVVRAFLTMQINGKNTRWSGFMRMAFLR